MNAKRVGAQLAQMRKFEEDMLAKMTEEERTVAAIRGEGGIRGSGEGEEEVRAMNTTFASTALSSSTTFAATATTSTASTAAAAAVATHPPRTVGGSRRGVPIQSRRDGTAQR